MRVSVADTRLFFDVDGASLVPDGPVMRERPTIVLLHGGPGGDHSEYKPFLSSLADVAQLVYLDLRGQGRSDRGEPESWNLSSWARDVRRFCDVLGIERPIVLGASAGSFVALRYAIDYPDHPSKLILLSTAARMSHERMFAAFERLGGEAERAAAERFFTEPDEANHREYRRVCGDMYSVHAPDPDIKARVRAHPELTYHYFASPDSEFDMRAAAAAVACPVLVVNGDADPVTPADAAIELAEALPGHLVERVILEGVGHGLGVDAPERVRELVREFVLA